ncbi:Consortin [Collichthys lucidus]|uniref:Consortin n=1 Tax=Collichthys lucidus TaxID=240159 RepID=A0A4U5U7R4_COLLU|nr:Consortin [Collichthys lucidus]
MSQVQVGGVDLCDNLPSPEALTAQTRNLNETNALTQPQSLSSNEKVMEEDQEKEGYMRRSRGEEEEDVDEVMKEEEEDMSEGSSSLIRCQSPDTPMTDSSYSETGSLLEAPYPLSPGTSPEPTSPVIPVVSPETPYPISQVALSQSDVKVESHASNIESGASHRQSITLGPNFTTGPIDYTPVIVTSDMRPTSPPGPACITEATDTGAKKSDFITEQHTSSTEPVFNRGVASSCAVPVTSTAETVTACTTSIDSTALSATAGLLTFTTGPTTTVSSCATGPIPNPALLESLEQLALRGDDTHLPQHLHQIAEAFVLHEDSYQVDVGMEKRAKDASCSQSSHPVIPPINSADGFSSPEISEKNREDPDRALEGREGFHGSQLTDKQGGDREEGEAKGGVGYTTPVKGNELHPSTAGEMDQSKPAEQQGGDLGLTQEKEAKKEEEKRDVVEAAQALGMEDEGEDEEEEKRKERDSPFCQKALPVETLGSEAEVEVQQLHKEALAEKKLHRDTQENAKTCLHQEAHLPQETHMKHQEQVEEEEEEEYEYEYEVEQADFIREAASLDDMAKLITIEEVSPASGLVSILKKRSVCVDNLSVSASSEPRPDKLPAKRRVRFKVPDDSYEHDVGGGDSCLLLVLLCLVTVVISLGGTALYCALGDVHSSVCQDFSRNADFYISQIQRGISHIHHWFTPGS